MGILATCQASVDESVSLGVELSSDAEPDLLDLKLEINFLLIGLLDEGAELVGRRGGWWICPASKAGIELTVIMQADGREFGLELLQLSLELW